MIYSSDEVENVEIKLPDNNYTELKVELQRVPQENYTIEGDTVKLNLGKLKKGYYTLQATMMDQKNYARTKVVKFYVE